MDATQSAGVDRISELARTRALRIAVVESLTSGGLAHVIGAGEDASSWFAGGITAYMTDVKQHLLKVTPGVDPCSAECAEQLGWAMHHDSGHARLHLGGDLDAVLTAAVAAATSLLRARAEEFRHRPEHVG